MWRRKFSNFKQEDGFTLLEIIAVFFLIALLYALVGSSVWNRLDQGRVKATQAQMAIFRNCLDDYRLDFGSYPSTEEGLNALWQAPPGKEALWNGPYINGPIPKDPWGSPYVYRNPGELNRDKYDLYSLGADRREGGTGINADLHLWREEANVREGTMER